MVVELLLLPHAASASTARATAPNEERSLGMIVDPLGWKLGTGGEARRLYGRFRGEYATGPVRDLLVLPVRLPRLATRLGLRVTAQIAATPRRAAERLVLPATPKPPGGADGEAVVRRPSRAPRAKPARRARPARRPPPRGRPQPTVSQLQLVSGQPALAGEQRLKLITAATRPPG